MKTIEELTQQDVIELISYDPITGKAYWNYRDVKWFKDTKGRTAKNNCDWWNKRFSGKEITSLDGDGYIYPTVFGRSARLHRLIWFRQTGEWPEADIDHINGIRTDNRWENLRSVSHQENLRNQKRANNNTSGVTGVGWHKVAQKWRAEIMVYGKKIHLGLFESFEEAVAARKSAEVKYGFHEKHGRIS